MTVVIVGAGSVGGMLAARLCVSGPPVVAIDR